MTSIAAIHQGTHPRQQGERRGASGNSRIPGRRKCECRGSRRRGLTRQALGVGAEHRVEPVRRRFDLKWTRKTYAAQASGEVATDVTIFQGPGGTGGVVTTAGIVFGLTMFALLGGDVITIAQVGSTLGVGLLIETLVVRTFLVPTIAVLLGRWLCHKPTTITTTTHLSRAVQDCEGAPRLLGFGT